MDQRIRSHNCKLCFTFLALLCLLAACGPEATPTPEPPRRVVLVPTDAPAPPTRTAVPTVTHMVEPYASASGRPEGGIVLALAIDPETPDTLCARTYGSGVFKSTDGGGSWTAANTGLTSNLVQALAIDPLTPATLYAGTRAGGVFKSTDGAETWLATMP